jgi:hypothetical protein
MPTTRDLIKDNRTDDMVEQDFLRWKAQQEEIMSRLKDTWPVEDLSKTDRFKYNAPSEVYYWDCKIQLRDGSWRYIEIKSNKKKYNNVLWNKRQWERSKPNKVWLLLNAEWHYWLIPPETEPAREITDKVSGKQVMVFTNIEWLPYDKLYLVFER